MVLEVYAKLDDLVKPGKPGCSWVSGARRGGVNSCVLFLGDSRSNILANVVQC